MCMHVCMFVYVCLCMHVRVCVYGVCEEEEGGG